MRSVTDPGLVPDLAPGLMRLASRLAGTGDAEDLVQSTWLRTLEHQRPVEHPRSWLRRVLVNERRMQLRGRLRRDERERSLRDAHQDPAGVEDVVHCLEVARIIDGLLDELPDDVRLVVRERYFGGDSAAEIARRHRIPAGTVRWRLKSGLDHLRSQLDARYGGRRALWAGGFLTTKSAPTLSPSAASQSPTAGGPWSAAAKGPSAMSLKILLAAGLTATAGGVAWVASSNTEPEPVVEASPVVAATAPSTPPSPVQPAEAAPTARERTNARAEWAARLARIQAASAEAPRPDRVRADADPQAAGMTWHAAGHEEIELSEHDEHHFCPEGHTCLHGQFTEELMGLVDACKDFMSHMDPEVGLTAHIIGVPDVGTIVESVELSSEGNASEALQECLTETMYTLDLGSTEEAFDRDITIMIGSASAADRESLAGAGVDAKTLAAIEQAMAERGHGRAHTMFIGDER